MTGATIDTVVFDIGGVLIDWSPRHLYARLLPDPVELDWFLTHVVTLDWHFQHDAGRPLAETVPELCARFPGYRALIEVYGPRWLETIAGPVQGVTPILRRLAGQGVPLFAITNFSAEFYPRFAAAWPDMALFQDVVISGVERIVKPDPALYAIAIARFGHAPDRMLFIDDRADNVAAAVSLGFRGHHFVDAATLDAALGAVGLDAAPAAVQSAGQVGVPEVPDKEV